MSPFFSPCFFPPFDISKSFEYHKIDLAVNGEKIAVAQSCPTLCDTMDYTVDGILQARILEWVAFPSPGDLPKPGIEARDRTQVSRMAGGFFTT